MVKWSMHYDSRIKRTLFHLGWRHEDFVRWHNSADMGRITGTLRWHQRLLGWLASGKNDRRYRAPQDVLANDVGGIGVCIRRRSVNQNGEPAINMMPPL